MSKNKINLTFIVNGVDVTVESNINAPLKTARNHALETSKNTGRNKDEWEIHDDGGNSLDPDSKIADLNLKDGDRLFLNLKVGAGGAK